ncbi:hypothetical protein [Pedobacter miscanthi]|uniref:Lipoprotein n=1 Tax=Pedobacter miscanthi TaxID=2259170 RepID=A0A366KYT9_9SPHI|nr:hypothetical protein [Pedobacter miscanthi]RBQ06797.1 hypothetical protein DRW42_13590 [Pedobacter miscanthi]
MKTKLLHFFIGISLIGACSRNDVVSFIPGTYVSFVRGEYSESSDTRVITEVNKEVGIFKIIRKSAFRRFESGKVGKLEHQTSNYYGIWDKESESLQIPSRSKIVRFFPDSGMLVLGTREFRKIM